MERYKYVRDSLTEQVQIIMPEQINGFDRLFGGKLVEWMDVVAAVVARRHSDCNVTTAAISNLQFKAPAYVNETLLLRGQMVWVGNTSMDIRVDAYVEALGGERRLTNTAFFTLVALDGQEKPTRVPRLIVETADEKAAWAAAEQRRAGCTRG